MCSRVLSNNHLKTQICVHCQQQAVTESQINIQQLYQYRVRGVWVTQDEQYFVDTKYLVFKS